MCAGLPLFDPYDFMTIGAENGRFHSPFCYN
jgi:hypothetical protein